MEYFGKDARKTTMLTMVASGAETIPEDTKGSKIYFPLSQSFIILCCVDVVNIPKIFCKGNRDIVGFLYMKIHLVYFQVGILSTN